MRLLIIRMSVLITRMGKIFLLAALLSAGLSYTVAAEAEALSAVGISAFITTHIDPPLESDRETSTVSLSSEDLARAAQDVNVIFQKALNQTARFSNVEILSGDKDASDFNPDSLIVDVTITQVQVEMDAESGKILFQAKAGVSAYYNDANTDKGEEIGFKLLGIGETLIESIKHAGTNLQYSVMSLVSLFSLPGTDLAIFDVYNGYPLVLFNGEDAVSVGDEYHLVSGTGEILGFAEISRVVPVSGDPGSTAAELNILYTDISVVPGVGLLSTNRGKTQVRGTLSLGYGSVGADITINGAKGQGFTPSVSIGVVWVWDNPYQSASFFTQQAGTVITVISGGFFYRIIPGRRLSEPKSRLIERTRINLGASLTGGYLFNLAAPAGNSMVYGSRYSAEISWYITDTAEISAGCQYDRLYLLGGTSSPVFSALLGVVSVTFRP